jgi:DNA-binding Xre family transcriptional regulator
MLIVESNLRVLVAEKEQRERRKIGIRVIADESGASRSTVERLLDNSIRRVPLDDLGAICRWLPAAPGDVLRMVEREDVADPA